tara:strand:- start:592 stop:1164 length:573 start_codon:yes stop_codon:yes gene_type:complete
MPDGMNERPVVTLEHGLSVPLQPARDRVPAAGLTIHREAVRPEWIDYNGHMNVAYYVLAFDHATDRFLDLLDAGAGYVSRTRHSWFVLETHVTYRQEVVEGDPLRFTLHLVDFDDKRAHYFFEMHHAEEGYLAATSEQVGLHVDLEARRSAPFPAEIAARLAVLAEAQAGLDLPAAIGRSIGLRRTAAPS